jgi:hypothetical protein
MAFAATRRGQTNVKVDEGKYPPDQIIRLMRLGRELRLTDQILADDLETLSIVQSGAAPAWTTLSADHISFAMDFMPVPDSKLNVAIWLGTNAHELGHVKYSPRKSSPLMHRVIEADQLFVPGLMSVHNIVEDQREERLMIGRFQTWRAYLTAALGHHLDGKTETSWLLMAGRTWLSDEVRTEARDVYVAAKGAKEADEITQLVGEYQQLMDPGHAEADEAWRILNALYNIFGGDIPHGGCGGGVIVIGEPDKDAPRRDDLPPVACRPIGTLPVTPIDMPPSNSPNPPVAGDVPVKPQDDQDKDGDKPGSGKQDGQGGHGGGAGIGDKPTPKVNDDHAAKPKQSVKEQLTEQAEDELNGDPDTASDIGDLMDALGHATGNQSAEGELSEGQWESASDEARRLWHEVGDALLDLKADSEPGWVKRVPHGKLIPRRLFTSAPIEEMFDRYDPGQMDAAELELVLLLDVSSSMMGTMRPLSEAAWAIRMAVDDIDGRSTVITYDDMAPKIMAQPEDRPDDRLYVLHCGGGTAALRGLQMAYRVLAESQARHRLMVILTDGAWGDSYRSDIVIEAMNTNGIITVLGFLGGGYGWGGKHGCTHSENIEDPAGLATLFRNVAAAKIADWR